MNILNADGTIKTFTDVDGNVINMEYRYLEYNQEGYVIKIYNDMPTLTNGNKIAIADNRNFEIGSEFDNYIVVQDVDENNNLTSSCMIKQPESVKFLRQERDNLVQQLTVATQTIADMTLQASDLQSQLSTMAQTIATMQIGG